MRLLAAGLLASTLGCAADDHANPTYVNVANELPLVVVAQGAALLPGMYVVWSERPIDHSRAIEVTAGAGNVVVTPWRDDMPCLATLRADVTDPWIVADVLSACE